MKKWEYMLVDFNRKRRVWMINGEVDPMQETYIVGFLVRVGKKGWEAVNMLDTIENGYTQSETILFKRELSSKDE